MRLQLEPRYHRLLAVLVSGLFGTLAYSLVRGLALDAYLRILVLTGVVAALTGIAGSHRPRPVLAALGAALAALGAVLALALSSPALPQVRFWVAEFRLGLAMLLTSGGRVGPSTQTAAPEVLATAVLLAVGGVAAGWAAGWLVWRRATTFPLLSAGVAVLGGQWLWFVEAARPAMVAYWLLWVCLSALVFAGAKQGAWTQAGIRLHAPPAGLAPATAISLALVLTVFALSLPSRFEPVSLESLWRTLAEALPRLEGLRGAAAQGSNRYRFTLARTGFGRNQGRLGGPVRTDDREALRLRITGDHLPSTLYLRGSLDSEYTGSGWRTPADVNDEWKSNDNTSVLPPDTVADLPESGAQIILTAQGLRTSTLFAPSGAHRLSVPGGTFLRDALGNLLAKRSLGREQTYVEELELTRDRADLLRQAPTVQPGDPTLAPFLTVPGTLPPRVAGLALQVTSGASTPYDQAVMLEAYLRSLPYDLDVPAPPSGRDFTDYFLFDLQRGYCSYSSTAMAVMLRTLGIPSRWVQGFAVPLDSGSGTYVVKNSQAHAWVEAFFPGYGWVVFDPTPRFTQLERIALAPSAEGPSDAASTGPGGGAARAPGRSPLNEDSVDPGSRVQAELPTVRPAWNPWAMVPRAIAGLLALIVIVALGLAILRWSRERLPVVGGKARLRALFRNLEELLARFGHGRSPDQTPWEWMSRLGHRWPDLTGDLQAVAAAYQGTRYGDEEPQPEALALAQRLWTALRSRLRAETPLGTYVWNRLRP